MFWKAKIMLFLKRSFPVSFRGVDLLKTHHQVGKTILVQFVTIIWKKCRSGCALSKTQPENKSKNRFRPKPFSEQVLAQWTVSLCNIKVSIGRGKCFRGSKLFSKITRFCHRSQESWSSYNELHHMRWQNRRGFEHCALCVKTLHNPSSAHGLW